MTRKKKIIYQTQWVAKDENKVYEHGWGFTPPLVEFPQDADPAWCAEICRIYLSGDEFECLGAIPIAVYDGISLMNYPKNREEFIQWKINQSNQLSK